MWIRSLGALSLALHTEKSPNFVSCLEPLNHVIMTIPIHHILQIASEFGCPLDTFNSPQTDPFLPGWSLCKRPKASPINRYEAETQFGGMLFAVLQSSLRAFRTTSQLHSLVIR